jgi:hypothetical protein
MIWMVVDELGDADEFDLSFLLGTGAFIAVGSAIVTCFRFAIVQGLIYRIL